MTSDLSAAMFFGGIDCIASIEYTKQIATWRAVDATQIVISGSSWVSLFFSLSLTCMTPYSWRVVPNAAIENCCFTIVHHSRFCEVNCDMFPGSPARTKIRDVTQ